MGILHSLQLGNLCISLVVQMHFSNSTVSQAYLKMVKTSKDSSKDKTISIRLSQMMLEALDARAVLDEKDRTQVIREAIAQYLELPEESVEDRFKVLEREQELISRQVAKLHNRVNEEIKRTDSLEMRLAELNRILAVFLGRLK